MRIEQWQIEMAQRTPPNVSTIVPGSTPVISFGDALRAEVATIGINPSRREFDHYGWLRGTKRRLATLESLGAVPAEPLSRAQAHQIVVDCNRYFHRNPYWTWFKPLDDVLTDAVGAGYQAGTACHLDLAQWATDPVWGRMTDAAEKELLLEEGRSHLETLLRETNVHLVLAAGKAVVEQLQGMGVLHWEVIGKIPMAHTSCTLFRGTAEGVSFVGWSSNLQSQAGANSHEFRARLAVAVKELVTPVLTSQREVATEVLVTTHDLKLDQDGHLPDGLKVSGKREFADTLRGWYDASAAKTIGDVDKFGGRPCIHVDLGGHQAVLNVDTKRTAVASYLSHVHQRGAEAPWRVVANTRGTVNKVTFTEDPAEAAGWYLYLRKPLPTPGEL